MGWRPCISKKCRDRIACERRCNSYFPSDPQYARGCRKACFGNYDAIKSPCDYLTLEALEAQFITARGFDPCEQQGPSPETIAAQLGFTKDPKDKSTTGLLTTLGIIAAVLLLVFILLIRK